MIISYYIVIPQYILYIYIYRHRTQLDVSVLVSLNLVDIDDNDILFAITIFSIAIIKGLRTASEMCNSNPEK